MIDCMDGITGSPCPWCDEPIVGGFAFAYDDAESGQIICIPCDLVCEPGTGK